MLKKIFWLFILGWCCTCLFVRCYMNLVGLETAKTVGEGKVKIGASFNSVSNSPILYNYGDDLPFYDPKVDNSTMLVTDVTVGVTEQLDAKVQLSSHGTLGLRGKYEFTRKKSILGLALGAGGGTSQGGPFLDFPAYLSISPGGETGLAAYFSPRYAKIYLDKDPINYRVDWIDFRGFNLGVVHTGERFEIGLDYGYFDMQVGKNENHKFGNIALGMGWRF